MTADLPSRLQAIRAELEAVTDHEAMPFRRVKSSDGSGTGVVDNHGSVIAYGCGIAVADLIASAPDTVAKLLGAVEAALAVHYEGVAYADDIPEGGNEEVPEDYERHYCNEDGETWPCPTVRALTECRYPAHAHGAILNIFVKLTTGRRASTRPAAASARAMVAMSIT